MTMGEMCDDVGCKLFHADEEHEPKLDKIFEKERYIRPVITGTTPENVDVQMQSSDEGDYWPEHPKGETIAEWLDRTLADHYLRTVAKFYKHWCMVFIMIIVCQSIALLYLTR